MECEWMFADAGTGLIGFSEIAHWNPLRWSGSVTFEAAVAQLKSERDQNRPVNLKVPAGIMTEAKKFDAIPDAVRFLVSEGTKAGLLPAAASGAVSSALPTGTSTSPGVSLAPPTGTFTGPDRPASEQSRSELAHGPVSEQSERDPRSSTSWKEKWQAEQCRLSSKNLDHVQANLVLRIQRLLEHGDEHGTRRTLARARQLDVDAKKLADMEAELDALRAEGEFYLFLPKGTAQGGS